MKYLLFILLFLPACAPTQTREESRRIAKIAVLDMFRDQGRRRIDIVQVTLPVYPCAVREKKNRLDINCFNDYEMKPEPAVGPHFFESVKVKNMF